MSLPDSNLAEPQAPRAVVVQKPKANVYTALLALSLVAIIVGCVCLSAELAAYSWDYKAAKF